MHWRKKLITIFVLLLFVCIEVEAQQVLSIVNKTIGYNSNTELEINLQNSAKVSAVQFDVTASLTNINFPSVKDSIVTTARFADHSISYSKVSATQVRIILFSMSNAYLNGTSGKLLGIKINSGSVPGVNNISLSNITLADSTGQSISFTQQNGTITVIAPQLNVTDTVRLGNIPMLNNTNNYLYLNNNGNDTLKITGISSDNSELTFPNLNLPIKLQQYQGYNLNNNIYPTSKGNKLYAIKIVSNDPAGDKYVYVKDSTYAVNKIYFSNAVIGSYNTDTVVSIAVKNQENFSAFQFTVQLPNGIDYVVNSIALDSSRLVDHVVSANVVNGNLTVIAYSSGLQNFKLNDGQILTFKIKLNKPGGTYPLTLSNAAITNAQAQNIISDFVSSTVTIKSATISLNNTQLYFGRISTKEYSQAGLTINNTGTQNLIISKFVYPSTALNSNAALPLTITPGNNKNVNFSFHSNMPVDLNNTNITIQSNDPLGDKSVIVNAAAYSKDEVYLKYPYLHHANAIRVPVMLTNYDTLNGVQFDIQINSPSKISFSDSMFVLSDRFKKYSASYQKLDAQNLRVILYSLDATPVIPDSVYIGELLLNIVATQPDGNYGYVDFANVVLGSTGGVNLFSGKVGQNINLCNGSAALTVTGTVNVCDSLILKTNTGTPALWYMNDTLLSNIQSSTYNVNVSGNWKAIISYGSCNYVSNTVQTIKVSAPAVPTISNNRPLIFCNGDSTVLTSSASSGNQWLLNGTNISGATNQNITIKASGVYTVQTTNNSGCSSLSLKDTVTVNALPAIPTISNNRPLTFCSGDSTILTSSASSGNQWLLNGANISGSTNQNITVKASGVYSVQTTNNSGCSSTSLKDTVTANALPAFPTISNNRPLIFCSGDSTILTSSASSGNQWLLNGTNISGSTNQNITLKASGVYTVQTTNNSGCTSQSSLNITIKVNPNPIVNFITSSVCLGQTSQFTDTSTITDNTSNSFNYQWNFGDGINSSIKNPSHLYAVSANYIVKLKVTSSNGCTDSISKQVIINSLPSKPIITINGNQLTTSSGLQTYTWLLENQVITGATSNTYSPTKSGNYIVIVVNAFGCSSTSGAFNYVVTAINPINAGSNKIMIAPNPAYGGEAWLIFEHQLLSKVTVNIFSANGILLNTFTTINQRTKLPIDQFSHGIYFVSIITNSGKTTLSLMVK